MANELAAKYWLSRRKPEFAVLYLNDCVDCYRRRGASRKVNLLLSAYAPIFRPNALSLSASPALVSLPQPAPLHHSRSSVASPLTSDSASDVELLSASVSAPVTASSISDLPSPSERLTTTGDSGSGGQTPQPESMEGQKSNLQDDMQGLVTAVQKVGEEMHLDNALRVFMNAVLAMSGALMLIVRALR